MIGPYALDKIYKLFIMYYCNQENQTKYFPNTFADLVKVCFNTVKKCCSTLRCLLYLEFTILVATITVIKRTITLVNPPTLEL